MAALTPAERVLVLAPTGRDAQMLHERLLAEGLTGEICADLPSLVADLRSEPGAVVVAQEALAHGGAEALLAALEAQEPWSDVPVLLLAEARTRKRAAYPVFASPLLERANLTILERPLSVRLFASSVRSAVLARRRQFQMRDLHRQLERAVQLSDMFVSILGHDLRNPLGAVRLAAEAIIRFSSDARALRPAGRILTSVDRMTRMIEQLLDFARSRQGEGIPLHLGPMQLSDLCRFVVQELEDAHPDARFQLREEGDLSGVWDVDRLAQVVTNLAGNAVEHGTPGKPIALEIDGVDPSVVRLRVQNPGTIPPAALPTLFEAFKGVWHGQRARKRGLGLGLFIAREIVRAHGGGIEVESSGGRTSFEVTLPRDARRTVS